MRIVFMVTSLLLLLAGAAIADGPATAASPSARKDRLADAQQQFDAALAELKAEPDDANFEQHKLLVEKYLSAAVYLVYRAKIAANTTWGNDAVKSNEDLTQLVALGYLKEWPRNPLNNWEPMKVLKSDSFSEGDLVFKLPPSSNFTTIQGGPAAVSFMVFVYGPIEAEGRYGKFTITDQNKAWGSPPHGALYGWDYWVESDSQRKEREREIKEYLDSHPEEAAKLEEIRNEDK